LTILIDTIVGDFPAVASSGEVNSPTLRSLSEEKTCERQRERKKQEKERT